MPNKSTATFETFGAMLKYLRQRAHLTQQEFGLAVGYSESYITRLEGDSRLPVPSMVKSLFIDALDLRNEPELAEQLIALANVARLHADMPGASTTHGTTKPTNLPAHLTRFIGRAQEVEEISRLIKAHRLVTLIGSGGVGKTRLAQETAADLVEGFVNGVWMIALGPLIDAELVPQRVASALHLAISPMSEPIQALCDHLADKQALLLLDNCEHLVQACAELAETALQTCPQLKILTTSREALRVPGEVTWRVPPMNAGETVELFTDRAMAVKPDFVLDSHIASVVASIGERLDGMPLAIELALSRMSGMSIDQLATRLGNRFRLLSNGSRTVLRRHQTLRALIDWSHDLLTDQERVLFRRLAVFAGGWTAEAAEHVCASPHSDELGMPALFTPNILPLLLNLVDKSLVVLDQRNPQSRYRLIQTIHEYAREQLVMNEEAVAFQQQHVRYFLDYIKTHAPRVMRESGSPIQFVLGADSAAWMKMLEQEYDNLRTALHWCLREGHDANTGIDLVLWLCGLWTLRGPQTEAVEWLACVLANTAAHVHTLKRVQLLSALAIFAGIAGDYTRAEAASSEAIALCRVIDNRFELMRVLQFRTGHAMRQDNYTEAQALAEEWVSVARDLHNARYEGIALFHLGIVLMHKRDFSRAAELHEESLRVIPAEEVGTRVVAQFSQAQVWWCQGDDNRALTQCHETLAHFRETGWEFASGTVLHTIGDIVLLQGDVNKARQCYLESLTMLHRQSAMQRIPWPLAGLAALAAAEGQAIRAVSLWAATDAWRSSVHSFDYTLSHTEYLKLINVARAGLDRRTIAAAEDSGRSMNFDQIVAYALAE